MSETTPRKLIFAYTGRATVDDATKALLIAEGYIPVLVDHPDDIRVIEPIPAMSAESLDTLGKLAMTAISVHTGSGGVQMTLGKKIAEYFSGRQLP